jgi:BirA family biotin operon repressor/biotin-[acetyl-CoA-carboxylase] ligase
MSDWPRVALIAGLAICDALEQIVPRADLRVKWPNDVYLADRKISGILSESIPGCRDRMVIGIGLNVNNRMVDPAISLIDHDQRPRDLTEVLLAVLDEFDRRWRELLDSGFDLAASAYRQRCFLTGKRVRIEQPGNQVVNGMCRGIDEFGRLRMATESGEQLVASGTVAKWEG